MARQIEQHGAHPHQPRATFGQRNIGFIDHDHTGERIRKPAMINIQRMAENH